VALTEAGDRRRCFAREPQNRCFQTLGRRADVWHSRCKGNRHVTDSFFQIGRRFSPSAFDGPGNFGIAFDASGNP
jgi:hypothetical protein